MRRFFYALFHIRLVSNIYYSMKIFVKIAQIFILVAILSFTPLVAAKKTADAKGFPVKTESYKTILTLWNIDTFEGGIGSRSDYLRDLCMDFPEEGVNVLVSSYTTEGAREKFSKGEAPDILSFGIGFPQTATYACEMGKTEFKGGELSGKTYAVPWCRGGYFLISKSAINGVIDRLIVSKSKYTSPLVAAFSDFVEAKEYDIEEPLAAYTEYLRTDGVLLGTQRDIWRLQKRGENFFATPLQNFSDLYQYLAITSRDENRISAAKKVAEYILQNAGKNIERIGMFSIAENNYDGEMGKYDLKDTLYTVSPFTSEDNLAVIDGIMKDNADRGTKEQKLKNIIKQL